MGLIHCPECYAEISDKAIQCPHCGYVGKRRRQCISMQSDCKLPKLKIDLSELSCSKEFNLEDYILSDKDNKKLVNFLINLEDKPGVFINVLEMVKKSAKEEKYYAKLSKYIKEKIANGEFEFTIDKKSEILPTIKKRGCTQFIEQVRLEKEIINSSDILSTLNNLWVNIKMIQLQNSLDQIQYYCKEIVQRMNDDLKAEYNALFLSLKQKMLIKNIDLRNKGILDVISSATIIQCKYLEKFKSDYIKLYNFKKNSFLNEIRKQNENPTKISVELINDFQMILGTFKIEFYGYYSLYENDSAIECFIQLKKILLENRFLEDDVLILINEGLTEENRRIYKEQMKKLKEITNYFSEYELNSNYIDSKFGKVDKLENGQKSKTL